MVLDRLESSLAEAAAVRAQVEQDQRDRESQLGRVRAEIRDLSADLDGLTEQLHRHEVAQTEHRIRVEQVEQRALEEVGLDASALLQGYGPGQQVLVGSVEDHSAAPAHQPEPAALPYVRADMEKRLHAAERALAMLGKVNPLALEEFAALEQRHRFLTEQLEDLRRTRFDLLAIVRDVDERVTAVLREAFLDTAREFANVFGRLFPGGEGRLVLTDPSDLLHSGIEVEARPPGKKVKRLSLLSGGERSLVAVAFLLALFKARPSPFYILDEVEAALDDTNLGRLLELYEELRENSQLLVITHQKRTMEVADALYGVAMRSDGVSAVISQRLREAQPA
jgi:chromosome segregation protein